MNRRGSGAEDGHYHPPHAVTTGARVLKRASRKERREKTYAYARWPIRTFVNTLVTNTGSQEIHLKRQIPSSYVIN